MVQRKIEELENDNREKVIIDIRSSEEYEIYSFESGYRSYLRLKLKKMMSQRYLIRWQEMILEVRPVIFVPECEEAICTARQRN